jgi:hypothetical protein
MKLNTTVAIDAEPSDSRDSRIAREPTKRPEEHRIFHAVKGLQDCTLHLNATAFDFGNDSGITKKKKIAIAKHATTATVRARGDKSTPKTGPRMVATAATPTKIPNFKTRFSASNQSATTEMAIGTALKTPPMPPIR